MGRPPAEVRAPDDAAIELAARLLGAGRLVAIPTETVYGLAADAASPAAVARLYAVKGRPPRHPVIVHLAGPSGLARWAADPSADVWRLAEAFWPGPLTLVVPRAPGVPDAVTGGQPTVGLRVPDHPVALAVLERSGLGLAAPSANRFGKVSPTTAAHVVADLGPDVDLVLDGGSCRVGLESTIVELVGSTPGILRPGAITGEQLEAVLGRPIRRAASGPARAPGMLASHYAPSARVELVDDEAGAVARLAELAAAGAGTAGLLSWRAAPAAAAAADAHWHASGDAEAFAQELYGHLRAADERGLSVLVVIPPPAEGVGLAARDRLRRAAAPRR